MTIKTQGLVTAPADAFTILPASFARVASWDDHTARKTTDECRAALKAAGFYMESVFKHQAGSKMIYGLFAYRTKEERQACFAAQGPWPTIAS